MNQIIEQASDHEAVWLLIPWYVNGRLDEPQRAHVDAHLQACQACRGEVLMQRQICQTMAASNPDIEQLPTASLRRLMQKIDAQENPPHAAPIDIAPTPVTRMQQILAWRRPSSLAASLAVVAAAALGFIVLNHTELADKESPADYYTVTSPTPPIALEVIRAVFAPNMTVADMQRILNEAQLHIVAGPTSLGVYSLAKTGAQPVDESLLQLRQHKEVLFAEPTVTNDMVASK